DAPGDDDITLNEERRELLAVVANDGAHRDVFGCPRVGEHDRHLRVLWWLTDHPQPTSASQHRALRNIEHLCDVGWGGHPRHSHDLPWYPALLLDVSLPLVDGLRGVVGVGATLEVRGVEEDREARANRTSQRPSPRSDQSVLLEMSECGADGWPGEPVPLRELKLCRYALSRCQVSAFDLSAEVVVHVPPSRPVRSGHAPPLSLSIAVLFGLTVHKCPVVMSGVLTDGF